MMERRKMKWKLEYVGGEYSLSRGSVSIYFDRIVKDDDVYMLIGRKGHVVGTMHAGANRIVPKRLLKKVLVEVGGKV